MNAKQFAALDAFRQEYKRKCIDWLAEFGYRYAPPNTEISAVEQKSTGAVLADIQKRAAHRDGIPEYVLQTPLVYNHALDLIVPEQQIKLIIIGDNPGKAEQLHTNQKYLIGQAGKLADSFFRRNPELGINFYRNSIILNKTPIHTARTKQLRFLLTENPPHLCYPFKQIFEESQVWLADKTASLQKALDCELWLVGYGELGRSGIFSVYADTLNEACAADPHARVFVYQHFSMNRFSIDLKNHREIEYSLKQDLERLGRKHRSDILGW